MANPKFVKLQTKDTTINRIQDNARAATDKPSPIAQGATVQVSALGAATDIAHNLGRKPQGAILINGDGTVVHLVVQSSTVDPERFISLASSGGAGTPITGTVWVF
jgi:hypothetical protein